MIPSGVTDYMDVGYRLSVSIHVPKKLVMVNEKPAIPDDFDVILRDLGFSLMSWEISQEFFREHESSHSLSLLSCLALSRPDFVAL